jgi:hypothetical protein
MPFGAGAGQWAFGRAGRRAYGQALTTKLLFGSIMLNGVKDLSPGDDVAPEGRLVVPVG